MKRILKSVKKDRDFQEISVDASTARRQFKNRFGMVLFSMCAAFSEMERELIRERVKAVLDAAHKKGRRGGRPKSMTASKHEMLLSLKKSEEFSVRQMCNMVGITRSVYYRAINQNKEAVTALKMAP